MKRVSNKIKKIPKEAVAAIIISILSVMLVVSIFLLEQNQPSPNPADLWQSIVISILCSIVASIIFVILQKAFSRSEHQDLTKQLDTIETALRRQDELYDSGIISIRPKSYFDNEDDFWKDIINNAEDRLDLIGHSLSKWFRPEYESIFLNKIKSMVESDKEVRIVLSDIKIRFEYIKLAYKGKISNRLLTKTELTIFKLFKLIQTVDKEKHKYLKIFVADPSKITYMYIRTDSQSIISPYIVSPSNSQNSFLLMLKSMTKYAKAFEEDFREIIDQLDCLDLSQKKGSHLELVKCLNTRNEYSGNGWNWEKTHKYIYRDGCMEFEVGYFEHYLDNAFVKTVIELPVSYGCPSKCKFCASSAIQEFRPLSAEQMMALFEDLYTEHQIHKRNLALISLTGMGDIYFNPENVLVFLQKLTPYANLQVTLSSCLWNKDLLERVTKLKACPPIRNIQITFVSDKPDALSRAMPVYMGKTPDFLEIINFIKSSDKRYYRINYILIKDLNDSAEDFERLRDMLTEVKDKVIVRISKLNETKSTKRNSLYPAESGRAEMLNTLLSDSGIKSYLFFSKQNDNMNCGQLITEKE